MTGRPDRLHSFPTAGDLALADHAACPVEVGRILQDSVTSLWQSVDLAVLLAPIAAVAAQLPTPAQAALEQLAAALQHVEDELYGVTEAAAMLLEALDARAAASA